jgi:hypothetical protein
MLERFHDLTTKPWWHGDISKKKAESHLAKAKKTGRYLVRYSTYPGDFIISVITIKKKQITFQHFVVSNIEAPDGMSLCSSSSSFSSWDLGELTLFPLFGIM